MLFVFGVGRSSSVVRMKSWRALILAALAAIPAGHLQGCEEEVATTEDTDDDHGHDHDHDHDGDDDHDHDHDHDHNDSHNHSQFRREGRGGTTDGCRRTCGRLEA